MIYLKDNYFLFFLFKKFLIKYLNGDWGLGIGIGDWVNKIFKKIEKSDKWK